MIIATMFLAAVRKVRKLLSTDHFSVDGTLSNTEVKRFTPLTGRAGIIRTKRRSLTVVSWNFGKRVLITQWVSAAIDDLLVKKPVAASKLAGLGFRASMWCPVPPLGQPTKAIRESRFIRRPDK